MFNTTANPRRLSRQLRHDKNPLLENRRAIASLSLVAIGCMGVISLYQLGVIKHLPDPPLPRLDADKVDASEQAYEKLSTPDAVLGLNSYASTLMLASMGGKRRAEERPWVPLAMAAKVGFDAWQGIRLTWQQFARHRAACVWCLVAAGSTFASLPLVWREARLSWKNLFHRR